MKASEVSAGIAVGLISGGFTLIEVELYPDYRGDPDAMMNVSAVLAVVFAGMAAVMVAGLRTRHEVAGDAAAVVVEGLLFILFLRAADPKYGLPPLAVLAGGVFGLLAYGCRLGEGSADSPPGTRAAVSRQYESQ